jgi:hypothetical protein
MAPKAEPGTETEISVSPGTSLLLSLRKGSTLYIREGRGTVLLPVQTPLSSPQRWYVEAEACLRQLEPGLYEIQASTLLRARVMEAPRNKLSSIFLSGLAHLMKHVPAWKQTEKSAGM